MSYYLQEDGTSKFLLEDGSGSYLLEGSGASVSITDTGVTVAASLASLRLRTLVDTGVSLSDSIAGKQISLVDTGATITTSLASTRTRVLSSTGLTTTDSVAAARVVARTLTDTGLSLGDSLIPGLHVVVLTDNGLQSGSPGSGPGGPLDNFNRADETPLSGGGNWGHSFTVTQTLNLVSNQAVPNGSPGQMSWVAGGALGDSEAYCTITQLPLGASGVVGVVCRQQTGSPTGEAAYFAYLTTAGKVVTGFWDFSGFANGLAVYTLPAAAQVGDKIGLQIKGGTGAFPSVTLTTWYQSASGGGWRILGIASTPFFVFASGYIGLRIGSATGGAADDFGGGLASTGVSDSLAASKINGRVITDTGLTVSDSIFRFFPIRDTGLTVTDSLHKRVGHALADTALTLTDSLGKIELADTGLVCSDSLHAQRVVPRALTDTGLVATDSTKKVARKVVTDTGLSFNSALVVRKNGGNVSINIADVGVSVTTSLAKAALLFRVVPGPFSLPEVGLRLSDGILVRVNGGPPDSCSLDFRRFLGDVDASPEYAAWCSANPSECSTWTSYASAILAGGSPPPPSMGDTFGTALVDAGIIALDGLVPCRSHPPPGGLRANFTYSISGLTVSFLNTSVLGPSGEITSFLWDFGDGNSETDTWDPWHTYASAGTYTVTLTVVGGGSDGIASIAKTLTVFVPSTQGIHLDVVMV